MSDAIVEAGSVPRRLFFAAISFLIYRFSLLFFDIEIANIEHLRNISVTRLNRQCLHTNLRRKKFDFYELEKFEFFIFDLVDLESSIALCVRAHPVNDYDNVIKLIFKIYFSRYQCVSISLFQLICLFAF